MNEFSTMLGVEWRAIIDSPLLLGPEGVSETKGHVVYTAGGPPAIELIESVPGTAPAGTSGISFHHIGFWTDDPGTGSREFDAHGWTREATVPNTDTEPNGFTLQRSPHGFYIWLMQTSSPRPYIAHLAILRASCNTRPP